MHGKIVFLCLTLLLAAMACNLLAPGIPSATPPPAETPTFPPIPSPSHSPTIPPIPPTQIIASPTNPPPVPSSTSAPTLPPPLPGNPYAVILVAQNDVLNVRQAPDPNSTILDRLPAQTIGVLLTGKQSWVGDQRWVEIQRSSGSVGWVNAHYLTEHVPAEVFCADPKVSTLLSNLDQAVTRRDGNLLASLVSPAHGLNLTYFRTGNTANYSPEETKWVFESTYETNWGTHPASGMLVKGSFHEVVLPDLLDVLNSNYQANCNNPSLGGSSYLFQWPYEYRNINFYSLYKAGSPGVALDWRTWLVGVEYFQKQPYLFSLLHLFWEP